MEGTSGRSRKDVAIILYPVAAGHCNYVSCLPHCLESLHRSDDMPVYTRSDHIEGIQYGHIAVRQTEAQFNGVLRDMTLEKTCNHDESEQTKAMTHLDLDDTKYHEVTNRQAGRRV